MAAPMVGGRAVDRITADGEAVNAGSRRSYALNSRSGPGVVPFYAR